MTETQAQGKMLLIEKEEPSDEAIILPTSSVDITDVSRMGFDLQRRSMLGDRNKVDPHEADNRFVQLLIELLEKVRGHSMYLRLSGAGTCTHIIPVHVVVIIIKACMCGGGCKGSSCKVWCDCWCSPMADGSVQSGGVALMRCCAMRACVCVHGFVLVWRCERVIGMAV